MHQQHQLRQRPQGGKTKVRDGNGNQRENTDRRIAHNHVRHFKHGFGNRAEHGNQRLAVSCRQRRQT